MQLRAIIIEMRNAQDKPQAQPAGSPLQSQPQPQQAAPQIPVAPSYVPRARFPGSSKYPHEYPGCYVSFRLNLRSKLTIDEAIYRTDEEKVNHAIDRLPGVAARRTSP